MRWLTGHARPDSSPPPRAVYNQAVALVCESRPSATAGISQAWQTRRAALARYRSALEQAGTISLTDLLPDLLHLHHARVAGPDIDAERACLHLARAAALSWLARTRKKAS
jgi:thiopeptide-type bacteriocin biosynthesis protein